MTSYRWINGWEASDEDWNRIDAIFATRGWMSLNRELTRIRVAEDEHGALLGFIVLQHTPQVGPLFVIPSMRGTGLAEELADQMLQFLADAEARGWFVVADSPHVPAMCEARGMRRITSPVYTTEVTNAATAD